MTTSIFLESEIHSPKNKFLIFKKISDLYIEVAANFGIEKEVGTVIRGEITISLSGLKVNSLRFRNGEVEIFSDVAKKRITFSASAENEEEIAEKKVEIMKKINQKLAEISRESFYVIDVEAMEEKRKKGEVFFDFSLLQEGGENIEFFYKERKHSDSSEIEKAIDSISLYNYLFSISWDKEILELTTENSESSKYKTEYCEGSIYLTIKDEEKAELISEIEKASRGRYEVLLPEKLKEVKLGDSKEKMRKILEELRAEQARIEEEERRAKEEEKRKKEQRRAEIINKAKPIFARILMGDIHPKDAGQVIGKGGSRIKAISKILQKNIRVRTSEKAKRLDKEEAEILQRLGEMEF